MKLIALFILYATFLFIYTVNCSNCPRINTNTNTYNRYGYSVDTNVGTCNMECFRDSDCRRNRYCCFNGCGYTCSAVTNNTSSS